MDVSSIYSNGPLYNSTVQLTGLLLIIVLYWMNNYVFIYVPSLSCEHNLHLNNYSLPMNYNRYPPVVCSRLGARQQLLTTRVYIHTYLTVDTNNRTRWASSVQHSESEVAHNGVR